MKKKLASLFLALALCLSLSVPALADYTPYTITDTDDANQFSNLFDEPDSGKGWSYDGKKITLNGFHGSEIYCEYSMSGSADLILAPGSKNTVGNLEIHDFGMGLAASISGSGELVINGEPMGDNPSPFVCIGVDLKLDDGLVMTGGRSAADHKPLTINRDGYPAAADGTIAAYIRIAPVVASLTGFSDVAAGSAFEQAIKWAVDQKITNGITATTFGPNNTCTVSHILTFLWRADGQPGDSLVDWAKSKGIEPGNLSASCTRALAVQFMWIAAGCPAPASKASFSDVPANAAYLNAMSWAVEKGITNGTSQTTFGPSNLCTRGQIVTFLYRAR